MSPFLFLILTLCAELDSSVTAVSGRDISYEDIRKANFSCFPRDTCAEARMENTGDKHIYSGFLKRTYSCRCDRLCSKLGDCCIDSPYRDVPPPAVTPSCRSVASVTDQFYVIDKCEVSGDFNPTWKKRCEEEQVEEGGDLRKIAPVTSLSTSMTYKNYYCLRCHETTNDFLYWEVNMAISYTVAAVRTDGIPNTAVVYDPDKGQWKGEGDDGKSFSVEMGFNVPEGIRQLAIPCDTKMISNCSDSWVDENVRNLCSAYMAVVYTRDTIFRREYRNVHCALCNFEPLEKLDCDIYTAVLSDEFPRPFHCVFNINLRGKSGTCGKNGRRIVWDDKKKIRILHCIVPGYVVKDDKCVPSNRTSFG